MVLCFNLVQICYYEVRVTVAHELSLVPVACVEKARSIFVHSEGKERAVSIVKNYQRSCSKNSSKYYRENSTRQKMSLVPVFILVLVISST